MRRLFAFLFKFRNITFFLILELVSMWLLFSFNRRYNTYLFNSSNGTVASVANLSNNISEYFNLTDMNIQLMKENYLLKEELENLKRVGLLSSRDTVLKSYELVSSKVINNSLNKQQNFITISSSGSNKIKPKMGVISSDGVVGVIKSVSKNYATVYSFLNTRVMVPSLVKKYNTNCTVQWDKKNILEASLKYIPRHIPISLGDTVVTSGFSSNFPPQTLVGTISDIKIEEHMPFYEARIKLSTDFSSLNQVFVVIDKLKVEKDSLEQL